LTDLQYQALKRCINVTHGSRKELVSEIEGVKSPRMVLDAAQARLLGKMMKDPTALGDLWLEEGEPVLQPRPVVIWQAVGSWGLA